VDKNEFCIARERFGKTQTQMAQLLGCSLKAIQSFEQGLRKVTVNVERHLLFLLMTIKSRSRKKEPCWKIKNCPLEVKRNCPAWEFQIGNLCWFINGTICHGEIQKNWDEKMTICRKCDVFLLMMSDAPEDGAGQDPNKQ